MSASTIKPLLATLETAEELSRDHERVIWRGRGGSFSSALVVVPLEGEPSARFLVRMRHEFAMRERLESAWAARPVIFAERGGTAELLVEDPGGDLLERHLRTGTRAAEGAPGLDFEEFLDLALRIAQSMAEMHGRGIVHKDIKPSNILVPPDDAPVRFTGFGFASLLPRHRAAPDPIETIEGTLTYMAPEQTGRMNRSVDARSDLYSLGIVLFEMLCGRPPFVSDDPVELLHCHIARRPAPPSQLRPDMPQPIAEIIVKLLAKVPEERYQTAGGLVHDLGRCITAWRNGKTLPPFQLATRDVPDRLIVPEKLYGRGTDLERLQKSVREVTDKGGTEIVLVAGYSGIGKSVLVGELHKSLIEPLALFASGKFDQYKRHIPYATWAQAFQGTIRQILAQGDQQVREWRRTILDCLGVNGRLITDLIPELVLLIGEQPPVPDLPPNEAQIRFFATFRRFLGAWATADHPLVLFLDDLQWIDPGSLKLFEYLAVHPELHNLLLICAYRDNEVGPAHPLTLALEAIRARRNLEMITLQPLSLDNLNQMVAETLSCSALKARPLADIIVRKTEGNPFFAIQFMQGLFEESLLTLGPDGWQWDSEQIAAKNITDNVVDLMVSKLLRLSAKAQYAMRTLACLGNTVSLKTLRLVHGGAGDSLEEDLEEALRASYLLRRNDVIRFAHDRIQEAAYFLLPAEERPAEHLRIGRKLLEGLTEREMEDSIFDLVSHFNISLELISDADEHRRVRRMNVVAGQKAKSSAAYASARTFFAQAMDMLPPGAWEDDYHETFELALERATCELLLGNFQQVDDLFPKIVGRARNNADRARAYRLLILRDQVSGRYGDAVEVALTALRMFGLSCPQTPADIEAAETDLRRESALNLRGRNIFELTDAPVMTDPGALAMLGILADAMPCAFLARPDLYAWLALNALNVTLRLGNTGDSCSVYMGYAIVLVSKYDEIDESIQYANVALRLQEKLARPDLKGRILVRAGVFINSRRNPIRSSIEMLREGFIESQAAGDYSYAVYGALEISWLTFESGLPLGDFAASALTFAVFAQQSRNAGLLHTLRAQGAFASCLAGESDLAQFRGHAAESLAALTTAKFGTGIAYVHLMCQTAALLHGDYATARAHSLEVATALKSITGWVAETTYHLLAVLTISGLVEGKGPEDVAALKAELAAHRDLLERRALSCPENYGCRHALAMAEIARLDGDLPEAERRYEEAIRSARDNDFLHLEAMAYEMAARSYRGRGLDLIADTYLGKARDRYARWGARSKVGLLEETFPQIAGGAPRATPAEGSQGLFQNIDVLSVVKASQAVSGEIALDRLVETLLRIAVENAGADRGVLVVDLGGTPTVVADARIADGSIVVESLRQEPEAAQLPAKILNYVNRAWKRLILDDATLDSDFGGDPYIAAQKVLSVMCLPMVKQSRLIGLLYLENSAVSRAFTGDRVAVLELLASQAAISLENSLLYQDLQRHRDALEETVAQRTAELSEKKELLDKILAEQEIILENASLGVAVVHPEADGRRLIRRANRAFERLFGYAPGEPVGMDTRSIWRSEEEFQTVGQSYKLLSSGQTYSGEHMIRRWNGEQGYCKLVGTALDPLDLSKGTIWLVEDITDRHKAEIALKAAKQMAEDMADAFRHKSEQVASLLDNSGQGFLSFGVDLVGKPEYSRACVSMLGEAPAGREVAHLLFPDDAPKAALMHLCVPSAMAEKNEFKQSLFLSLLPAEIELRDLILKAEYSVLDKDQIMLVLTDITEERRLQEKVRADHLLLQMVVSALTDSRDFFDSLSAFREFITCGIPDLLQSAAGTPLLLESLYREIHTYKGTLNQFNFQHAPKALHLLEERLNEMRASGKGSTIAEISACMEDVPLGPPLERDLDQLRELIGDEFLEKGERVTITAAQAAQLEALASSLLHGETIDTAAAEVRRLLIEIGYLRKTPLRDTLAGFGRSIVQIAARLEKEVAPMVIVGGDDVWIDPAAFMPFVRSLVHVFRNALAHGIEEPDVRLLAGKDEEGHITCTVRKVEDGVELTISDDGAGVDIDAVRGKAVEIGLLSPKAAAALPDDKALELIFTDSVTTSDHADYLSGRGIGLAAVRNEAEKLGGRVSVQSVRGKGTSFRFILPTEQQDVVLAE